MSTNTKPAAETLTSLREAEACLESIAGRLDTEGFKQLALLCIDQAGASEETTDEVAGILCTPTLSRLYSPLLGFDPARYEPE